MSSVGLSTWVFECSFECECLSVPSTWVFERSFETSLGEEYVVKKLNLSVLSSMTHIRGIKRIPEKMFSLKRRIYPSLTIKMDIDWDISVYSLYSLK